ncbi:N-acetylmuramoyl-L-alanine amidase [Streptomyces sp. NPDC047315]|uniref:N-acetylmuramoyl-L-alanine amidase n=1 Tax=Streptomyces sp. NPDC047315 TaxID=3155142 RepID=UPI0033E1FE11
MPLVTRAQLGWPASAAATQTSTRGVKIHYEGTAVSAKLVDDHQLCLAEWKNIRRAHLADKTQGYSDVAYNYAACVHGYLMEGRGLRRRTGANGNATLNRDHFAIVALIGSKGLTQPTDALLHALRDGIELLREHGAGQEVKGHRDGYATACPGGPLYDWVERGAPRPGGSDPVPPSKPAPGTKPAPRPTVDLSKLIAAAKSDPPKKGTPVSYYGTKTVESALVAERLLARELADGHFGKATIKAYAAWQRKLGYKGADADGVPGAASLKKLGDRRGFTVTP